jgi:hypothetical protein
MLILSRRIIINLKCGVLRLREMTSQIAKAMENGNMKII